MRRISKLIPNAVSRPLFLVIFMLGCASSISAQYSDSLFAQLPGEEQVDRHCQALEKHCLNELFTKPLLGDTLIDSLMNFALLKKQKFYEARALFFKGMIKYRSQKLEPAFELYTQARKILEGMDSTRSLAELYHNIGLIYYRFSDKEQSTEYLHKAIALNKAGGFVDQWMKNEIAITATKPSTQEQIDGYKRIRRLSAENHYDEGQFIALLNVATLMNNSDHADSALVYLKMAEDLWEKTGNDRYIANIWQLKGLIYKRQKKLDEAQVYLEKALSANLEKEQNARVLELYLNLSGVHAERGDFKQAYEYLTKHRMLRYTFDLQKKAESVAKLEADYRVELKENENKLLRQGAELSANKLETARRQRVLLAIILIMSIVAITLLAARFISRQRYTREQEEVNRKLKELNHEMESVLQVVSHDFRTPLAKIKMLSELIMEQDGAALPDRATEKLGRVNNSVREAEDLVSDILEIKGFYEEEQVVSDPVGFNLEDELSSVIDQYSVPINLKKLTVHFSHSGEKAAVLEKDKLKRVLSNLISNAVKFTEPEKEIWVRSSQQNNAIQISVKDQGPGFTEEEQKSLFKKFAKFANKPIAWGTSHGLGLFIVKKLVDRLGGSIQLKSKPGEGSEFVVELRSELEEIEN